MVKQIQFLKLLDHCIHIINRYINQDIYPEFALYTKRYQRMLEEIEQIKEAIKQDKLATDFNALEITNMLDHNDPVEIIHHVLQLNHFYETNYKKI